MAFGCHAQFSINFNLNSVLPRVTAPVLFSNPSPALCQARTDGVLDRKQLPLQLQEVLIKCAEERRVVAA